MNGSIALGWLLATVLFALLGNAVLTVVFFICATFFSWMTIAGTYKVNNTIQLKGENDE